MALSNLFVFVLVFLIPMTTKCTVSECACFDDRKFDCRTETALHITKPNYPIIVTLQIYILSLSISH